MSNRYVLLTGLVIAAAAATYFMGGGSVQLWDRDEAWYAQASKQMVESGNWLVTYFLDQPRYSKPIFVYWLQAGCMTLLGANERAARLPSAVAMTITLVVLAGSIGRALGVRRAFHTVLVFSSSLMVMVSAKMCLTDSVLLTFITIAQLCLFGMYWTHCRTPAENGTGAIRPTRRVRGWVPLVFWLSVGLAGLTKGPIVLAVLIASLIALACLETGGRWRSWAAWKRAVGWWGELRPLLGVLVILGIVAPWLIAAYLRDPSYLSNMLLEPVRHTTSNQDGQLPLPGYYLIAIWPTFFPWCVFLPLLLVSGWRHRQVPHIRFALATVLGNWLLAELMVTKLPHYMLPSFAALAFLCSSAIIRAMRGKPPRPGAWFFVPCALLWAAGAIVLGAIPWLPSRVFTVFPRNIAMVFSVMAVIYIAAVVTLLIRRRLGVLMPVMGLGMLLLVVVLYAFYCPAAWFLRMPVEIGQALRDLGATRKGEVIMTGFFEPSVAFYQGGTIRERPPEYLSQTPPAEWPRWIVATEDIHQALDRDRSARLRVVGRFQGLNYNASAKSDLYSRVSTTRPSYSTIASRDGNEYKSLLRIETVLILEKR